MNELDRAMYRCNICGGNEFKDFKSRKDARCKNCKSLERTRLLWMYIDDIYLAPGSKVLHLAPEIALYAKMKERLSEDDYVVADFSPESFLGRFPECIFIDLCDLDEWPSNYFDLIIHSHVLEHTPCNIAYSLYHLHRMLSPRGRHMFVIPISSGGYDESFQAHLTDSERTLRFGQSDHVRRFGRDQMELQLGKLLKLPKSFDARLDFPECDLIKSRIPKEGYSRLSGVTVFSLEKYDMKLLSCPTE